MSKNILFENATDAADDPGCIPLEYHIVKQTCLRIDGGAACTVGEAIDALVSDAMADHEPIGKLTLDLSNLFGRHLL